MLIDEVLICILVFKAYVQFFQFYYIYLWCIISLTSFVDTFGCSGCFGCFRCFRCFFGMLFVSFFVPKTRTSKKTHFFVTFFQILFVSSKKGCNFASLFERKHRMKGKIFEMLQFFDK